MTPLTPTSTIGSPGTTQAAGGPQNPGGQLGQDDFLKLMIAQLQSQNPLQPASNTEYLSQLATFTQLEQMTNLANAGELSGGVQLIGHKVTYTDGKGATQTGTVESVQTTSSGTTLTVSGTAGVAESNLTEIV
jgi:flagellar basal-body rod modification protein FlgD